MPVIKNISGSLVESKAGTIVVYKKVTNPSVNTDKLVGKISVSSSGSAFALNQDAIWDTRLHASGHPTY